MARGRPHIVTGTEEQRGSHASRLAETRVPIGRHGRRGLAWWWDGGGGGVGRCCPRVTADDGHRGVVEVGLGCFTVDAGGGVAARVLAVPVEVLRWRGEGADWQA